MSYYDKSNKLLFIHIPKTAGSSVEQWFKQVFGLENIVRYKHAPISYKYLNTLPHYKFTTVRNPYARAVSWYQELGFIVNYTLDNYVVDRDKFKTAWEKGFDYFVQYHFDLSGTNPSEDIIMSPNQTMLYHITIDGKVCVDTILRQENLENDFKKIQDIVGTNIGLGRYKVGYYDHLRDYKTVYTDVSRKLIEEIYKTDLEYFNYDF